MTNTQTEIQPTESQKLTDSKEIIAYLAEKFPLCFILEGEAKPLKIGLFQDLAEALQNDERVSKTQLRQALRQYTTNWRYLYGCREGAERVDLYGNGAGILEAEHVAYAAQQLAEAKARFAQKRKAELAAKKTKKYPNKANGYGKGNLNAKARSEQKFYKSKAKKTEQKTVDLSGLKKGDRVKVKLGEQTKAGKIIELLKDSVRVELRNGLVVNIPANRLFL